MTIADLTGGTEVIRRQVQRTLAGPAIIGPAQPRVPIETHRARLTARAHCIVLAGPALQRHRITGSGVTVARALPALALVERAVHPGVAVRARLAGQSRVAGRTVAALYSGGAHGAERPLGAEFHGGGEEGSLQLVRVVLGPDEEAPEAAQAAHKLVLGHAGTLLPRPVQVVVPVVLKKHQLDRGVLAAAIVGRAPANPDPVGAL